MSRLSDLDQVWHRVTPAQQGIWVLDRSQRWQLTYLVPSVIEFTGPVDHAALVASVQVALDRHPALRARFRLNAQHRRVEYRTDGEPAVVGFTDAADTGWSREEISKHVEGLCYTPLDLAAGPPVRAEVIRVDAGSAILVLNVHHIVFDGWSRTLLMDEITSVYRARIAGRDPGLPEPTHPAVVTDTPPEEETAAQVARVVDRLRGAPVKVELPLASTGGESLIGASTAIALDEQLTHDVMTIAKQEGCTPYMIGLALLAGTFARMGRQRDFLFASGWPGRDTPDTLDVIGMLMTTVMVRVSLDDHTTWRQLLGHARKASTAAFVDGDVPLDAVTAALNPHRDSVWPPLSQVLVNMSAAPRDLALTPEVRGRYLPLDPLYAKYDLALFVGVEAGSGGPCLVLSVDYLTELFTTSAIAAILTAIKVSAKDLAHHPEGLVLESARELNLDDPTNRLELVRSVWQEVLGVAQVSDDVSFFDAGGDSLLLVLLVERLSQASGYELRSIDLFRAGTVRGHAEQLAKVVASVGTAAGVGDQGDDV